MKEICKCRYATGEICNCRCVMDEVNGPRNRSKWDLEKTTGMEEGLIYYIKVLFAYVECIYLYIKYF